MRKFKIYDPAWFRNCKEIKLHKASYLDRESVLAGILFPEEERKLEFRNGIALAEVVVYYTDGDQEDCYHCFGLIDENFQEVYAAEKINIAERNLMFFEYNRKAERFSDNDYLVEYVHKKAMFGLPECVENRHIRVVNGVPTLIRVFDSWPVKTRKEGLVIIKTSDGFILYDMIKGTFVTPELVSIKESEENTGLFNVTLRVTLEKSENKFEFVDYLFFWIDSKGQIVSSVLSSLENGNLTYISEGCTIGELLETRKECLRVRESQFGEEVREFDEANDLTSKDEVGRAIEMKPVDDNKH